MTPSTAEVLRKACELYEAAPSHVRGCEEPRTGTYCVVTALGAAAGGGGHCYRAARNALADIAGEGDRVDLALWNAEHSTAEVVAAFRKAAELAEESA